MDKMIRITYALVVLLISGVIGLHLGRFRKAYTEMTGMMAGMTMGMLNGFLLGYASAAALALGASMFWGNLFGILLGIAMGVYFGRAGGLMGILDGGMGGVMGGSMGAMLAVMVAFPREAVYWTGLLLAVIYIAGMAGLVALIEQSAPEHAALHRVMPMFTRAVAVEAAEEAEASGRATRAAGSSAKERRLVDYYALLDVYTDATDDEIEAAYLELIDDADDATAARLGRAVAVLTDPQKRWAYDLKLAESQATLAPAAPARNGTTVQVASQGVPQPQTWSEPVTRKPASGAGKSGSGPNNGASGVAGRGGGNAQPQARGQTQQTAVQARPAGSAVRSGSKSSKASGQRQGGQAVQKQQVRYARQQQAQQNRVISVSWVGGLAILVTVCALGWGVLSASGRANDRVPAPNSQAATQLEAQAVSAPVGADGKQTLDLVVDGSTRGYKPSVIKVKQGVPVHFNLSLEGGDPG